MARGKRGDGGEAGGQASRRRLSPRQFVFRTGGTGKGGKAAKPELLAEEWKVAEREATGKVLPTPVPTPVVPSSPMHFTKVLVKRRGGGTGLPQRPWTPRVLDVACSGVIIAAASFIARWESREAWVGLALGTSGVLMLRLWVRAKRGQPPTQPADFQRGSAFDQAAGRKPRLGKVEALAQRVEIMPDAVRVDRVALCRSYAWYRVVIDDPETHWSVWKRFSDFSKLRKRLSSDGLLSVDYKDWKPPSLPPKSFLHHSDRKFLEERRQALNNFLPGLLEHPSIRRSACMTSFLHEDNSPTDKKSIAAVSNTLPEKRFRSAEGRGAAAASADSLPLSEKRRVCRESLDNQLAKLQGINALSPETIDAKVQEICNRFRQPQVDGTWEDASLAHEFHVRGPFYLDDRLKVYSGPAVCQLVLYQLYRNEPSRAGERIDHVAAKGKCRRVVEALGQLKPAPFLFILNIQVPGTPPVSMVMIFALPTDYDRRDCSSDAVKFRQMLHQYYHDLPIYDPSSPQSPTEEAQAGLSHRDHFRNQRFKLIPRIVDGPYLVRTSVGAKPALLGQKLTQRYFRGKNYVETDVHVGSNSVANHITGLTRSCSKLLTVHIGITLEGREETELPEKAGCSSCLAPPPPASIRMYKPC